MRFIAVSADRVPPRPPLPRDNAPPRPPPPETDDEEDFPVPMANQPIMVGNKQNTHCTHIKIDRSFSHHYILVFISNCPVFTLKNYCIHAGVPCIYIIMHYDDTPSVQDSTCIVSLIHTQSNSYSVLLLYITARVHLIHYLCFTTKMYQM